MGLWSAGVVCRKLATTLHARGSSGGIVVERIRGCQAAVQADVKVVTMPPPRPNFLEPGAIVSGLAAHRFFDGRVDEYPLYQWPQIMPKWPCVHILGSTSLPSPVTTMVADISSRSTRLRFPRWHRREPQVGVEARSNNCFAGVLGSSGWAGETLRIVD
jgi:hypothetical protein